MYKTFSLNRVTLKYVARVLDAMERNKGYIIFFNGANYKEAYQRIFTAATKEEKSEYTSLDPYIKNLARNVMKTTSKDIPMALYNEDGEVAVAFTELVENPADTVGNKELVMEALKEIYLLYPEDFITIAQLLPTTGSGNVNTVIKNEGLKKAIFKLMGEYDSKSVFYGIIDFMARIAKEKAERFNKTAQKDKDITLIQYNQGHKLLFTDKQWLLDNNDIPVGIDPDTYYMEDDFNPEMYLFRFAIKTTCTIWRVDISDYLSEIEEKIYLEPGVDNECIFWCDDKYRLTTPAGVVKVGISREAYMDLVRREVVSSFLKADLGTIIALGPDSIYIKLTKATNLGNLRLKNEKTGKSYILPVEAQKTVPYSRA